MEILSITLLFSGILIFAGCLPMVHNRIPMNKFYGARTKASFKNDESWYHLNEIGGMIFAMIGFPLILAGALGLTLPESMLNHLSLIVLIVTFLSIGAAMYFFVRYSSRYSAKKEQSTTYPGA